MPTYRQRDTQLATHTMKNLCITGSVQTSLDNFANMLRQAGATPALPASRNADMSMATWHRKVLATHSVRAEDPDASPTLGRAWEQMAGDIFLANHEQPLWFWAECGSVSLLDFWREFDPSTCFVLLHTSPKQALFEAIDRGANSPEELENVLDSWYQRTQQVLRFHLRHPARSILVDGDHALGQAGAYLEALASRWQLSLMPLDIEPPVQANDPLLDYLVDELLQQRPEALALDGEVQASLFQPSEVSPLTPDADLDDALASHLKALHRHASERTEHAVLLEKQKTTETQLERTRNDLSETRASLTSAEEECRLLLEQLHQTQAECEKLIQDNQRSALELESQSQKTAQQLAETTAAKDTLAQENAALQQRLDTLAKEKTDLTAARDKLTGERDQQAKLASERQARIDTLAKEKTDLTAARDALAKSEAQQRAQMEDIQSENELLLLNLHQTQEECERLIVDHQRTTREQQSQSQKAAQQLAETTAAKDTLAQENAALQQRLDALAQEKAGLATARDEQAKLASERQARIDTLAKEKTDLTAARDRLSTERDQQAKLAAERQVQLDTLAKQQAELLAARDALAGSEAQQRAQIDDIQSENELLLLNLHQTQEELEQYLLRAQATEAQCAKLNNCLQRVLSSHPDYWMFDRLEASLLESTDTQQTVQWQLTGVYLGERLIPELRFKTVLVNGLAGIVIQRSAGIDSPEPLLRWPGACATAEELPCIPVQGSATQGNNALLSALGPTDWKALQTLVNRLAGLLGQPDSAPLPEGLDAAGLRSGLLALEATLAAWPKLLRYDAIELQETPQGGGYQSLAISLTNLQLGERHWPALDYRLASVDEPGQSFGQNPRLEFPESTRTALQNWFAESDDERGARLELRFALPDALDTRVWNRLDGDDRLLIAALLANLGSQHEALRQASGASQPGQDWPAVVGVMKNILARHAVASHQTQGA